MDYIPVPNTCQLELIYNYAGERCETVLHYLKASPWDLADLTELCVAASALFVSKHLILAPTNFILSLVRATDLGSQTGPVVDHGTGLPLPGIIASPSLPNNCCMVITKRTAQRGRSFRGRIYHPYLVEPGVISNDVIPTTAAAYVTAWNFFKVIPITADEAIMCVVSRFADKLPRATGLSTIVTNLTTDAVVDSQRRRLPGRGN